MGKALGNSATLSANGLSDWVALSPGPNIVTITSASWGTGSVTLAYSEDMTDANEAAIKNSPGGDATTFTSNESLIAWGKGKGDGVAMRLATQSGGDKVLKVIGVAENF